MDKRAVADTLERIGTLLELKGENVFKTRAYQNGARLLLAPPTSRYPSPHLLKLTPATKHRKRVAYSTSVDVVIVGAHRCRSYSV